MKTADAISNTHIRMKTDVLLAGGGAAAFFHSPYCLIIGNSSAYLMVVILLFIYGCGQNTEANNSIESDKMNKETAYKYEKLGDLAFSNFTQTDNENSLKLARKYYAQTLRILIKLDGVEQSQELDKHIDEVKHKLTIDIYRIDK